MSSVTQLRHYFSRRSGRGAMKYYCSSSIPLLIHGETKLALSRDWIFVLIARIFLCLDIALEVLFIYTPININSNSHVNGPYCHLYMKP